MSHHKKIFGHAFDIPIHISIKHVLSKIFECQVLMDTDSEKMNVFSYFIEK